MARQQGQAKAAASTEAEPRKGFLTTSDGPEIYYEDSGGQGPVLVYLYGLACSPAHWKYQMAHFAKPQPELGGRPYRQVWFDFRGHGRSPALQRGQALTMRAVVQDVSQLCSHLRIEKAHFLGQSMGGSLVLQLAVEQPQLVQSLVLLASPARDPGQTLPLRPLSGWIWRGMIAVQKRAPDTLKYANYLSQLTLDHRLLGVPFREIIRSSGFNPMLAQTADIEEYIEQLLKVDFRLFSALASELSRFDATTIAGQVHCPVLLITGAHDQIVPVAESRRLLRYLPNAHLEVIPHGSHCPHFDDAPLVNGLLSRFLAAN